jgi:tripartite-type tricarboxylate transporter receptor subunit TctC
MKRNFFRLAVLFLLLPMAPAYAQDSFYKGQTVRIIVGASAGGGYDTYSRTIARHIGKHISGNPTFVVENMPGAGFLISANYMYKVAKPDGLTIGHFIGGLFLQQLLGKPGIEFDAAKFEYIGVPTQDDYVIGVSKKTTGISTMDEWMKSKTVVKLGGVGAGSATDDIPKVLMATIGLPAQLVSGYKGTADVRLAYNNGEVQGVCNSWQSFTATWPNELKSDMAIVLQTTAKSHSELTKVPLAMAYAKTDEAKNLIRALVHSVGPAARPYLFPPGTPKDRLTTLRKAFMDTMKDPEFLADAKKAKLDINPLDGAELERNVHEVFKLDKSLIPRAKEILK